jgi:hypothetical protein
MKGHRTCKICKQLKTKNNFAPQGYQCRQCRTEKQRLYYAAMPPKTAEQRKKATEYQKAYRLKNLEKVKQDSRVRHIKRKFNLTQEEYNDMLKAQNGVCATCNQKCKTGNHLAVDHDHKTGKIRGLLCKDCNTSLGLLKEDIQILENLKNYIILHTGQDVKYGRL